MKRKRWLWAAILIIVIALLGYGYAPARHPVARELTSVSRARFERVWSKRSVLLLGLGDSVTAGYGASPGRSYFKMLVSNPDDDAPEMRGINLSKVLPKLEVANLSMSGSTSLECLDRQLPKLKIQPGNVLGLVCITTGGNDLIHNYGRSRPMEHAMYGATWEEARPWVASFEERLERILETVESRFPGGCHIFLATIYDPTDGVGDIENAGGMKLPAWPDGLRILGAYNQVIRSVAGTRKYVHLVDMHKLFLGHGIHHEERAMEKHNQGDRTYWYYRNLEDPNDLGYDAIRKLFLHEIEKEYRNLE